MDRCIGWKELGKLIPYCRQHVLRLETEERYAYMEFPKRVVLGQCRVCWWLSEIMEWLKSRPRR
jgi:predicted DNA-binding transcriptional regulator AlpA